MGNNIKAFTPLRSMNDAIRITERLKKRYDDPDFLRRMGSLRASISGGKSLHEARLSVLPKDAPDQLWNDMVHALAMSFANPAYVMLEWQVKQADRYKRAAEVFDSATDNDEKLRALLVMQKIDEYDLELKKALGIIKPLEEVPAEPMSEDEIRDAERRFRLDIKRVLEVQDSVRPALPPDVLDVTESGRETDQLGSPPMAQKPAGG